MGCCTRTEVTYLERWPYSTNSLLPWIIGEAFSGPGVGGWSACPWASALPDVPNVTPPANAAFRTSLRLVRFGSIVFPFECDQPTQRWNHVPTDEKLPTRRESIY